MMGENTKILLVEDEAIIAISEKIQLEKIGYIVHHVLNGEKAIQFAVKNSFDLILMDIDLGTGIDGTQAAQEILKVIDIPVVFLSSHTEPDVVEKTEEITSYGYVVKNSGIVVLDTSIKMALKLFNEKIKNKQAKEVLREQNERIHLAMASASAGVWEWNDKTDLIVFDNVALRMIGYEPEFPPQPWEWWINQIYADDQSAIQKAYDAFIDGKFHTPSVEFRMATNCNSYIWVASTARIVRSDERGKAQLIVGTLRDISEQKHAEKRFRALIENAPDGITITNSEGLTVYASPNALGDFGYSQKDLEDKEFGFNCIHPDDLQMVIKTFDVIRENPKKRPVRQYRYKKKNGEYRWIETTFSNLLDDPAINGFVLNFRDITENKKTVQSLKAREEELNAIFNTAADGMRIIGPDFKMTRVNDTFCKMVDLTRENIIGKKCFNILKGKHCNTEECPLKALQKDPDNRIEIEDIKTRPDGKELLILKTATSLPDAKGKFLGIVENFKDMTEYIASQRSLFEANTIISRSPVIAFLWRNEEGWPVEFVSSNVKSLLGYSVDELVNGKVSYSEIIHKEDIERVAAEVSTNSLTNLTLNFVHQPYRIITKDGSVKWIEDKTFIRKNSLGRITHYEGIISDITENKRAEKEIVKQLKEKETLLREVHHRVKNNIANIENFLLLQIDLTNNSEAKGAIKKAVSQVQSMRILYEKLLLSKDLHVISIKSYVENLIDSFMNVFPDKKNTIIKKQIMDFNILANKAITIGIIINELLTNILKYAFNDCDKGTILISIEKTRNIVTIIIKDNGIGIDKRIIENKSPGFGLTLVRMLAEQLNGTYTIKNDNGTTSVICFEI